MEKNQSNFQSRLFNYYESHSNNAERIDSACSILEFLEESRQ